jgi:hypothetical protein
MFLTICKKLFKFKIRVYMKNNMMNASYIIASEDSVENSWSAESLR